MHNKNTFAISTGWLIIHNDSIHNNHKKKLWIESLRHGEVGSLAHHIHLHHWDLGNGIGRRCDFEGATLRGNSWCNFKGSCFFLERPVDCMVCWCCLNHSPTHPEKKTKTKRQIGLVQFNPDFRGEKYIKSLKPIPRKPYFTGANSWKCQFSFFLLKENQR